MSSYAKWQFPSSNGGADFVQDPSSTHFSDAPIPKLIREVVQNSLDARDGKLAKPVIVKLTETSIERDLIGASELERHLKACHNREKNDESLQQRKTYTRALKAIKKKRIRCLQIVDSGTTGLKEANWDALVSQEGAVQKSGKAPGGSYGIGKNAVFNVSDLKTVFYSTRYLANRKGRMEKLQGKATLMTHDSPFRDGEKLQHIGFYRGTESQEPILGNTIPDFFRLDEQGTGVFVMGFNPRADDWVNEVACAVIENFFYAIHHKRLVVEISAQGSKSVKVTHETMEQMFFGRAPKSRSYHYYKAIRDEKPISTSEVSAIGSLEVFLTIGTGPKHIAHVNRNGMLITDSKAQRTNPLAPRGSSLWPDFAVVVVPASDDADKWIRRMENPSHDSISTGQLFESKEQRDAERAFKDARYAIRKIIDEKVGVAQFGDTSNLQELAELFPDDLNPTAPGNKGLNVSLVPTRLVAPSPNKTDQNGSEIPPKPDPDPDPHPIQTLIPIQIQTLIPIQIPNPIQNLIHLQSLNLSLVTDSRGQQL